MALSNADVWEVRTTGSDANGGAYRVGAGTAGSTFTDLAVDATNPNKVTSASYTFVSGDVGKSIKVNTASATWNTGYYHIDSVASGAATLEFSPAPVGSTAGSFALYNSIDYTRQDAAQVAYTDLVIGGTTTQLTSAATPFTAAHVGNVINVTGGTGFTLGWFEVMSVSGSTATMDRAVGTAASTGGTGNLGGAMASPGMVGGLIASGNTVWIRAGTYTHASATPNVSGGMPRPALSSKWSGYGTARGDCVPWGTFPILKAGAAAVSCFNPAGNDIVVEFLEFDGNKANFTGTYGYNPTSNFRNRVSWCRARNAAVDGFSTVGGVSYYFCEAIACTGNGFGTSVGAEGCTATSCGVGFKGQGGRLINCASYGSTTVGFSATFPVYASRCASVNSGTDAFNVDNVGCVLDSCVIWTAGGYGLNTSGNAQPWVRVINLAVGGCASGNYNPSYLTSANFAGTRSLSADPFVNAAAGNFAPNATSGGGLVLRAAGNGAQPGPSTTSYPDIGPAQHQDTAVTTTITKSRPRISRSR